MHEKIADAFEGLVSIVMIMLFILVVGAGIVSMVNGEPIGFMIILVGIPVILTMFGVLSIFISIRRHLMAIDKQLSDRPM